VLQYIQTRKETPTALTNLIMAVWRRNLAAVKFLLMGGAGANSVDSSLSSALHYACRDASSSARSPSENTCAIVRLLLDHGADPNLKNDRGRTALHFLCNADRGGSDDSLDALEVVLQRENLELNVLDAKWVVLMVY